MLLGRPDRQDRQGSGAAASPTSSIVRAAQRAKPHHPSIAWHGPNIVARCRRHEHDAADARRTRERLRVGRRGVLHGDLCRRPWDRQVQDRPARPLRRDDARLRAVHRRGARHARPVARGRRAGGLAGPRRDRPAAVAAERRVRARQPLPARRALPDVPAHRPDPPGRAGARAGLRLQPRHRDRVLLRPDRRARTPRAVEPARHARQALLRRRRDARVDRTSWTRWSAT